MRQGYNPKIVQSRSKRIIGFALGSDACAEHECGTKPLQQMLTIQNDYEDNRIVSELRAGNTVEMPNVLDRKRITQNLDRVTYQEVAGEEIEAYLGFCPVSVSLSRASEKVDLRRWDCELNLHGDDKIAGAWDRDSFAIRVRGKKNVKMLRDFYEQLMLGKVCFAGTFAKDDRGESLEGLTLMIEDRLRAEYIEAIAEAQKKYESGVLLKAASREGEITALGLELGVPHFGFMWPIWDGKEVVYGLNPMNSMADYYGPYTFEQLEHWVRAKCSYHLKRHQKCA